MTAHKTEAAAVERQVPQIDPNKIVLNASGHAWQSYFVELPEGFLADDLKEPSVFTKIQTRAKVSLRRHDHLYLVAHDNTWFAEAVVADANAEGVILAKPRITQMVVRYDDLPQTNEFRVVWAGTGYQVRRKTDNAAMSSPVHSVSMAAQDMAALYPRVVGR